MSDDVMDDLLWNKNGWIARVTRNEDGDGWAVEMTREGDEDPALVGPWVMGRDKKNPKPLNTNDFNTLVKTAREVLERHQQHARAQTHKSISYLDDDGRKIRVDVDMSKDEDDARPTFSVFDDRSGELLGSTRVQAGFKLSTATAMELVKSFDS